MKMFTASCLKYNFVETPRKFIIAELLIRKLGSLSVLFISTDEDPSLRIESSAMINLCGVSTKLYFNLIFTMKTYKELISIMFIDQLECSQQRHSDWSINRKL